MKIAMMVRGFITVPQPRDLIYAPIDLAISIAHGLVKQGHQVDFYAPMGSKINGVNIKSLNLDPLIHNAQDFRDLITNTELMVHNYAGMWDGRMVSEMFAQAEAGKYDILYFVHPESGLQGAFNHPKIPVVYTLHDPVSDWYKNMFGIFNSDNQYFVSISNNQRREAPDLNYVDTIYNGLDINKFPYSDKHDDYLLFVGRIVPDKGVREAVQVAKATHHRLIIIGPVIVPDTQEYFDKHVKPFLDDQILYLGFMEPSQLPKYYQKAKALLTPVQWEEPFGMTTIEAMASGTPVITFRRGAAPEIIIDGKTGFVVDTTAEMIEAVHKIKDIDRRDCREHVRRNFSTKRMVNDYAAAFENILNQRREQASVPFVQRQLKKVPETLREVSAQKRLKRIIKKSPIKAAKRVKKQK